MKDRGLTQRDLVPIIGSRSKVSEILSGTRDVTMPVARALHKHLDIPSDVLLQEPSPLSDRQEVDWKRFPLREMMKRGWISRDTNLTGRAEELIRPLLEAAELNHGILLTRKNDQNRVNAKLNPYALLAWQWQVVIRAKELRTPRYTQGTITADVMKEIAQLSRFRTGPRKAVEKLTYNYGVPVVHVPHLSRTYLDGGVLFDNEQRPCIGITLRYDRIDNFWYTLMHELAHICRHSEPGIQYFDDLSMRVPNTDTIEREADELAGETLLPSDAWEESGIEKSPTPQAVMELAMELGINPAIVAGRIRHRTGEYRKLSQFVGSGAVRILFSE